MKTRRTAIRACNREDLARIAEIHKAQFRVPGVLLGHLSQALIAVLYGAFLDRSIFLVHTTGGEVDGFVLGGSSRMMMSGKLSFFRKHALFCIFEIARRPRLWLRAFRSFLTLNGNWLSSMFTAPPPEEFRMLSIAVAASATRNGVGTALVRGFEAEILASCHAYSLNVLKTNVSAIRFYKRLAFQRVGETAVAWKLRKELAADAAMPREVVRSFSP